MASHVSSGSLSIPKLNTARAVRFHAKRLAMVGSAFCCMILIAGHVAGATAPTPTAPSADWEKYATPKADTIEVYKSARLLQLKRNGKILKSYHVALGRHPVGQKMEEGDGKTPEGTYFIDRRNIESEYHLSLHISYPEKSDLARAAARGVPAGGSIMIHGEPNILNDEGKKHLLKDWTAGCIALNNRDIDEIWRLVDDGVTVDIYP
jgi:murein L,D-transpeptidase YafK